MYLNIPKLTRCVFCFPLRRGLITFGYINLIYTLLTMSYISYDWYMSDYSHSHGSTSRQLFFRGNLFDTESSILLLVYSIDAILFVLLLVGAHKKQVLQLKIFLLYGAVSTVAALLVNICFMRDFYFPELLLLFFGTVLQMYLLVLVRSEILKLEKEESITYIQSTISLDTSTNLSEVVSNEDPGFENPTTMSPEQRMIYEKMNE